jgi:hypothetical protein
VERDAYKAKCDALKRSHKTECDVHKAECDELKRSHKAECDALKRKCEDLRQDLESAMLHACKGPFSKGAMPLADADEDADEESDKSDGLEVMLMYSGGLEDSSIEDSSMHGQGKATFTGDKIYECQFNYGKRQGPMPDDVDDIGHEDKKAKSDSELKQVKDAIIVFKQHFEQNAITNSFAGHEEHHGDMLPEAPPESPTTTLTMLLPDAVPDPEHLSDELEPLDLGHELICQLGLGDMSWWPIHNGLVTRIKAASDAYTAQ